MGPWEVMGFSGVVSFWGSGVVSTEVMVTRLWRHDLKISGSHVEIKCRNTKYAQALQVYLLSRDHSNLKSEFQQGKGKFVGLQIKVSCIEKQPPVDVVLGQHVHLTVGDYFASTKAL
ncbi:hypothetical protein R6Q57_013196 [Mikania cordata]